MCLEREGASRQKVNSFSVLCCQKFRGQREGGGGGLNVYVNQSPPSEAGNIGILNYQL